MAFNLQTFKTRALTAIVFVVVMLVGLLYNHWTFLLLFSIVHFGCWLEYFKLMGRINADYNNITPLHRYGVMVAGWAFMLLMTGNGYTIGPISLHMVGAILLLLAGIILPLFLVVMKKNYLVPPLYLSLVGLLYISLSWGLLINLRNFGIFTEANLIIFDTGYIIPVILIASIWINDTMAYIVGSFIGKTPFSKISPKKTWEGTAGGAILCVALVTLGGHFLFHVNDVLSLIIISSIAAVVGTAGDLLESKLKRMAGVKDSGQIMPGHGGFLDRFDSLILATPVVWLYVFLFNI